MKRHDRQPALRTPMRGHIEPLHPSGSLASGSALTRTNALLSSAVHVAPGGARATASSPVIVAVMPSETPHAELATSHAQLSDSLQLPTSALMPHAKPKTPAIEDAEYRGLPRADSSTPQPPPSASSYLPGATVRLECVELFIRL